MNCPKCKVGTMPKKNGTNYRECKVCGAIFIDFTPFPYQTAFLKDKHNRIGVFGGYGCGKTSVCCFKVAQHALKIPFGKTLLTAPSLQQLSDTAIPILMRYIPESLIAKRYSKPFSVTLKNGHTIVAYASNDEQKLRSIDLTCYYAIEASGIDYDIITQLDTRTRNIYGYEYLKDDEGNIVFDENDKPIILKDNTLGIIESNPDMGYIRDKILFTADKIYGRDAHKYNVTPENRNPMLSVHIATTRDNPMLSPSFIANMTHGKPDWWIKRYIEGSFEYAEGAVYPTFSDHIVEPFSIPASWVRLFGVDFGLRDPTVMLATAIDPETGIVYVYNEHYESDKPVNYHAKIMNSMLKEANHNLYCPPVADPKGKASEISSAKSLFTHYLEYGIVFKAGNNSIIAGINKVYTYFLLGKLKIFNNCVNLIKEGGNYKYPELKLDSKTNNDNKPVDKDNHAMDALRYIICELPDNPEYLTNKHSRRGYNIAVETQKSVSKHNFIYKKSDKEWWQ